jgi:pimeloyl-ACP methyl ester carboxylesterase
VPNAFTNEETEEFIRAYQTPKSIFGAFHWFAAFPQDVIDNQQFMKHKLKMPLLAMGSEYNAIFLPDHCRLVAENVTPSFLKGVGHWIVAESTEQVQRDLLGFLLEAPNP